MFVFSIMYFITIGPSCFGRCPTGFSRWITLCKFGLLWSCLLYTSLAAVNLVMPIIIMSFAISDMVAVGSAVQISIALGRKDTQKANQLFSFACSIIFVISCIVCLLGLCLAPALVSLLGSTGMVANLATQYLRVYAGFSPVIMCFFAVDNYLRICRCV